MRSLLAVAVLCASTMIASGEETYVSTGKVLGTCLGEQMQLVLRARIRISPDALDNQLKLRCGHLEDQERQEFTRFVSGQVGHTLTAETAIRIVTYIMIPPEKGREAVLQSYKCVMGFDNDACNVRGPSK